MWHGFISCFRTKVSQVPDDSACYKRPLHHFRKVILVKAKRIVDALIEADRLRASYSWIGIGTIFSYHHWLIGVCFMKTIEEFWKVFQRTTIPTGVQVPANDHGYFQQA